MKADYGAAANAAATANVAVEFCGTGITSRATNTPRDVLDGILAKNAHFIFTDNQKKGYGVCELTPTALKTTLRVVNDVTLSDAAISTLASFAVQMGKPVIERVG